MDGVDTMCKAELVMLCEKLGIDGGKTVPQLRYHVKRHYETHPELLSDDDDDDAPKAKKHKVDSTSKKAATAAATTAAAKAGPSACPHAGMCPDLHSLSHRLAFSHDGFRSNPFKCRDGMACLQLRSKEHLAKYAHEDDEDKICPKKGECDKLHLMDHRMQFEHPGFRAKPVPCRDGMDCALLTDKQHLFKYAHEDSSSSTSSKKKMAAPATASTAVAAATTTTTTPPTVSATPPPKKEASSAKATSAKATTATSSDGGVGTGEATAAAAAAAASGTKLKKEPSSTGSASKKQNPKLLYAGKTLDDYPLNTAAETLLSSMKKDSEEFWELEEKFNAHLQGSNEDYVEKRIKSGKRPLRFILVGADKVSNPILEARFEIKKLMLGKERDAKDCRERVSFHGTHPKNIKSILHYSLLPFKHELNPCKSQVDEGYFGTNKKGIYVSRYADYTLKYSNRICSVEPDEEVKVIMFRTVPGKTKHIPKLVGAIDPTPGFDSHSSPTYLEWYLFDASQACPHYVLHVKAVEDTRTAADDE